jgi:hypothetical protein
LVRRTRPRPREDRRAARVARRDHAVEHVDPEPDRREHVLGQPDAHQITRLVSAGAARPAGHLHEQIVPFADRDAADRDAGQIHRHHRLRTARAQLAVGAALHDPEQRLAAAARVLLRAALEPRERAAHAGARERLVGGYGVHSSNAMMMSAPSACWIWIERSGVSSTVAPSTSLAKRTPRSEISAFGSENTWKPPLSVRIGPSSA